MPPKHAISFNHYGMLKSDGMKVWDESYGNLSIFFVGDSYGMLLGLVGISHLWKHRCVENPAVGP